MTQPTRWKNLVALSSCLLGMTTSQAQSLAWVSSEKDNAIALVNLAQGKVVAIFPAGGVATANGPLRRRAASTRVPMNQ